jgi:uncharacterized RmlC-like cupin family protein
MVRRTAIDGESVGARTLWMGRVTTDPGMKSGAHHHGDSESAIFVISGRLLMLSGHGLSDSVEAGPGDYIYVPPHCVHVEMNASDSEPGDAIVVRDRQENIVVPVDAPGA